MAKNKRTVTGNEARPDPGNFPLLRVCGLFIALVLALHLIQWFWMSYRQLELFQVLTAKVSSFLISASGLSLVLDETSIVFKNARWEVTPECTAISAMIVFGSFILAYPASVKSKIIAVLTGIPFLFAANIIRLFLLAWATEFDARLAEYVHDYVWQVAFLFLVAAMWLAWLSLVVKHEERNQIPG